MVWCKTICQAFGSVLAHCVTFMFQSIKRGKLDERAEKGVFVRYAAESKEVHKCDQTTPSILEPTVESTSIEDPLDVEATSDTTSA
ncbi:hypothetical protein CK203_110466 [Vitis vinifera]|uniref:Uncharacterized protein n=1 Tax=Vitis vinifera TaxID=29760 RepID=A0A438CJU2_VITVI|nr:hypothetical protein CK203_110466 [Vitis vinifera]